MAGSIYKDRMSASMIAKRFKNATGKEITPEFIHWFVEKVNSKRPQPVYTIKLYGREVYYSARLYTDITTWYSKAYPIYKQEKEERKKRKKQKNVDYNPDAWIEGNRKPRFYTPVDENRINRIVKEAIDKTIYRK